MMPPIMSGPEFWSTSMLDSTGLLHQGQQPSSLQGPANFSLSFHHHCTSSSSQSSSSSSHISAYSSLVSETSQDPSHEFPTVSSSTSSGNSRAGSRRAKKSTRTRSERKKSKSNKRRTRPSSKVIDQEEFGEFEEEEEEEEDEDHDVDEYGDEDDEAQYQDGYRQPQQRHAANLRERRRMQSINEAFEGLRERIPTLPYEKRLSKVDTLRLAIGYINFLGELVRTGASSLNPNGTSAFPSQRYCCPPPPKKVLVKSHLVGPNGTDLDSTHSLSWESDENRRPGAVCHSNHTLVAKVWTPEDPRGPAHVTVSSNNNNNSVTALSNSDQNQQQSAMFQHVSAY